MSIILSAVDKMSRVVDQTFGKVRSQLEATQRQADHISKKAFSFGRDAATIGASLGMALAVPVKIGMEFEQQMAQVGAVARASDAELQEMTATARRMGAVTQFSATEAAQAMQFLAMAGFGVQKSQEALPATLNLAAAGAVDLATAADIASNILSGFGKEASQLADVNDVLVNTFTTSNTNLQMLGQTMKYVAPIANTLGAGIDVVAGMAGKLGDAGIQADQAGTSMRMMFLRLASPMTAGSKILSSLGISTQDAAGNLKPMPELLGEIGKVLDGLPSAKKAEALKKIFGTEAASAAAILTQQAATGELQKYIETLSKSGTAQEIATKQMNTQRGAMLLAKSAGEELALTISDALAPSVTAGFQAAAKLAGKITAWTQANPELTATIVKITAALAILFTTLGALAFVVGGVAKAWAVLNLAFLFSPVGLTVVAIAALAAGMVYLWKTSDKFRGVLVAVFRYLQAVASIIKNQVVGQAQALATIMEGIATFDGSKIKQGLQMSRAASAEYLSGVANMPNVAKAGYYEGKAMGANVPVEVKESRREARRIAPVSGGGGATSVNYSPVINIGGNTTVTKEVMVQVLQENQGNLLRALKEARRREARVAY